MSVVFFGSDRRGTSTFWKVSQPPVGGMYAEPCSGPSGEPVRSSMKPPAPPEEARTVIFFCPSNR